MGRHPLRRFGRGSRTSAALTQVLLQKRHGIHPSIESLPMNADAESAAADAVLLIGDRAMRACLPGFRYAYDLGDEWTQWTGLPFVYAVWAVRPGVDLDGVDIALREAKDRGLAAVGEIATREAAVLGLGAGYCRRYLTNIIHFDLGPRELAGLQRFYELACNCGLAPWGVSFERYDARHLVESR
ncbi:MAG: MqnA/MqnD/SBP family protein [Gemmataceae bacterium]